MLLEFGLESLNLLEEGGCDLRPRKCVERADPRPWQVVQRFTVVCADRVLLRLREADDSLEWFRCERFAWFNLRLVICWITRSLRSLGLIKCKSASRLDSFLHFKVLRHLIQIRKFCKSEFVSMAFTNVRAFTLAELALFHLFRHVVRLSFRKVRQQINLSVAGGRAIKTWRTWNSIETVAATLSCLQFLADGALLIRLNDLDCCLFN